MYPLVWSLIYYLKKSFLPLSSVKLTKKARVTPSWA